MENNSQSKQNSKMISKNIKKLEQNIIYHGFIFVITHFQNSINFQM